MHSRHILIYVFLISIQNVVSQFKCDYRMYGRPKLEDCASTFLAMPHSKSSASTPKLDDFRRFVEPQLLEPPFAALENDLGTEMQQIPKFWRYSKPIFRNITGSLTKACLCRNMPLRSHGHCSCERPRDRSRAGLNLGVCRARSSEVVEKLYW